MVLKIRDYRSLVLARFFGTMALQSQAVIVGWQVYTLRKDPLLLGLLGLVEAIPAIGFALISGYLVDISSPSKIYRLSLIILFINTCLLCLAASPLLHLPADTRLILIFLAVFVSGAARSFIGPSFFSLVPQIVPRHLISTAAAWTSSTFQFAAIVGPAIGGLVYGTFGAGFAFTMLPVLMAASWLSMETLSAKAKAIKSDSKREPILKSIHSGIIFVWQNKVLLSAMTLDMFSVLFGGAVAVLPIYADQVLHVGSSGLGVLRAAQSVGAVALAVTLALRPLRVANGKTLLWVVAGFGLSILGFAVSTNFWLSLVFLAASGAFDGVSMILRSTIMQLLTPDHMRGRVSSVNSVFITSSNEIGAFESGVAARYMGLVPSVIFGGSMTLIIVAVTAVIFPDLRKTRVGGEHTETVAKTKP